MKITTILFDLDNTLVRCMIYYDFVRKNMFRKFSKISGVSQEEVEEIFSTFEKERVKKPDGFGRNAFLDSINETRIELLKRIKDEDKAKEYFNSDESFKLITLGSKVYDAPYVKYNDVDEVLTYLKNYGIKIYCVTKGDFYIQSQKVANLPKVFDGLFIVPHKNKAVWKGVAETIECDLETTYVVGDSIKDDIIASIDGGLKAIHITRGDTNWVGDPLMNLPEGVKSITQLSELKDMIS